MRTLRFLMLAAVTLVPGAGTAQDAGLARRLDAATLSAVRPVLEAATRDSLPLSVLESKILEGAAKGIPAARIAEVVIDLADDLRVARVQLRSALPSVELADGEISATAMAMRQGIPVETVLGLWEARRAPGSLEIPLVVLGELVRRGISAEESAHLLRHVVSSSISMELAVQIPGKMDRMLSTGGPAPAALQKALQALSIPLPPRRGPNR